MATRTEPEIDIGDNQRLTKRREPEIDKGDNQRLTKRRELKINKDERTRDWQREENLNRQEEKQILSGSRGAVIGKAKKKGSIYWQEAQEPLLALRR